MKFDHDVFISYAHLDDETVDRDSDGWVSALHRALQVRVSQLVGEKTSVWRDPKLQGNDVFGDSLVDELRHTALLAAVLTPRYAASEWCMREVHEFRSATGDRGVQIGNKTRLFKIVKTPLPPTDQPEELQDTLGYEFFVVDPATGRARELDPRFGADVERLYWAKLDDLAFDMSELLRALRGATSVEGAARAVSGSGESVYLAETTADLRPARDQIRRDLRRRGYSVLPDRPLPVSAEELESLVREQLERCRLSIHPIGRGYGFIPEGADRSVIELQSSLAGQRLDSGGFLRLTWIPPDVESDDERQRRLLETLRTEPRKGAGADLLEVPLEDLTTEIDRKLMALESRKETVGKTTTGQAKRVYLICEALDIEETEPLRDLLFDHGCEVVTPVFEGDEAEIREDHEENLRLCDAALVYWGAGGELWLRRMLRELLKSAGLGRDEPLEAKAVYVAPPESPAKDRLRTREALVLRPEEGAEADLKPFLDLLR